MDTPGEITALLQGMRAGDEQCRSRLITAVYAELRKLAAARLRWERADHSLQPSALVNEAYLKMVGADPIWRDRVHFFAAASGIMRNILVDNARARRAQKRDGGQRVQLEFAGGIPAADLDEIINLDVVLKELARLNRRHCDVVEMRFFAGLTFEEIAEVLGISARTAKRDWDLARSWLQSQMKSVPNERG